MGLAFMGKALIILGIVLIIFGGIFLLGEKIPWIGRLPGDIYIQKKNFTFYFPVVTSILISIILTFIFWLFGKK